MYTGNFAAVSNQVPWAESWEIDSADDGSPIDLTPYTITLEIRRGSQRGPGTVENYLGLTNPGGPVVSLSTATGGITLPQTGVFQWLVPASVMQGLQPGLYETVCRAVLTASPDTDGVEIFVATLPVIQG